MSLAEADVQSTTPPRRRRLPWSFLLAGLVILGVIGYLIFANTQVSAVYYMTVAELKNCTECAQKQVRVAGDVLDGSIQHDTSAQMLRFTVIDAVSQQTMQVSYKGIVPDAFQVGAQVVVEGKVGTSGIFDAHTLLAKCPSKFEEATPPAN